jgi:hypothetical protein
MVLPALLVAWVLVLCTVAVRLPTVWGEILLLAGLSLVTILNIAKITPFVLEQRAMPFYEKYRDGKFVTAVEMAKLIREKVEPGKKTLGPSATLMTYLSGRLVVTDRDILPAKKSPMHWPEAVAKAHIDYAVFPSREYRDKDEAIARLMERGLIRAGNTLGTLAAGKMYLAEIHVRVPEGDWRKLPLLSSIAAKKKAALARARAATTRTVKKKPTSAQIRRWMASTRPVKKKKKVPTSGQIRHWKATTRAAARAAVAQKHDPGLSTRPSVSPTTLPAGPRPSSP